MKRWFAALALLAAACGAGSGAEDGLVLRGRVIDGTGAPPIEAGVVVVEGDRIRCAGAGDECSVPRGARTLEVEDGTILPGLIDLHVQLPPAARQRAVADLRLARAVLRRLVELGGADLLAAGTDAPNPYVVPGGSLHQELELLVDVGLSPVEAIRAAGGISRARTSRRACARPTSASTSSMRWGRAHASVACSPRKRREGARASSS